jgi:SAM-dependent methyltransferase
MASLRHSLPARKLKRILFTLGGHHPSSRWYGGYRLGELCDCLSLPFSEEQLPRGYGRWIDERIVEYPWLFSRLPAGPGMLLDAGSVLNHEFVISHPKLRDKKLTIMTLAPEPECHWFKGVSYVYGDLRNTVFRDNIFDYVVSISTLEHVGLDNQRFHASFLEQKNMDTNSHLMAVKEFARVIKPGGRCFISVPFGRRIVQDWFQLFNAEMIDQLIETFRPESYKETCFRYGGDNGWQACDREAAADARYFDFQNDQPWEGHPAAAEAVVCLELRK